MEITEILIAVLLGILVFVSSAYLTYFCWNKHKKATQQPAFSKKGKIVLNVGLLVYFAFSAASLAINLTYRASPSINDQIYVSINSASMAAKKKSNGYLEANHLDNQIAQYDVAVFDIYEGQEIQKYDIILYEKDGILIAHRIIQIYENDTYLTQGDNNDAPDEAPISKGQIKGIYNRKLRFLSFVNYLGYTPGFYVAMVGVTYDLGVLLLFEILSKKSAPVTSISHE